MSKNKETPKEDSDSLLILDLIGDVKFTFLFQITIWERANRIYDLYILNGLEIYSASVGVLQFLDFGKKVTYIESCKHFIDF